ncbi:hypothetical protein Tco_0050388 [Tanacetum coccineum]
MVARLGTIRLHNSMVRLMMLLRLDHVTKNTNVVEEVYDHGTNDEIKEWIVGQASLTKDDVSTSFTLVVGRNIIIVVDVFTDASNTICQAYDQTGIPTINTGLVSYINIPYVLTKANLQKLEVNVSIDVDYDVWLPLASVHEVNDRMKNLFYRYFTSKRLAFPLWNGLCATIRKSMDSRK